ncbi:MAG: hypothetical protein JJ937_12590 [Parvibaculum sp.]|nr:hypothetical protein [Parvibaculum sp.]
MPVEEIDALETVPRERPYPVVDRGDHGGGTERHRAREAEMMLRDADIEGRPDKEARFRARAMRDRLRADRIRADEPVRPVLLRRADGDHDSLRLLKIGLDFGPARMMQQHGGSFPRIIGETGGDVESGAYPPSQRLSPRRKPGSI